MDFEGSEDAIDNFSTLLMALQNYISIKIPAKKLTPNSELLSFFNIQSILNKDHKYLTYLLKLLLCISSFCSKKKENLKIISGLDLSLVKAYYDAVYLFLLKNTERKSSQINSTANSILEEEQNSQKKEIDKLKKLIKDQDLVIRKYKTSELIRNDISLIQTDQDFLGSDDIINFDLDFDLNNNAKNYKIEKNISFCFEKFNIKQIYIDSLPISQKNTNNSSNSFQVFSISKHNFNLSGGDFLHKKIDILDETILKNREMYQKVITDFENEIKNLKQKIEELKNEHNEFIARMKKDHEIQINNIIKDKNLNNTENLIKFRNEKNAEIENLRKMMNEKEKIKNKEIEEIERKIREEKARREKETELFNDDRIKRKIEYDKKINELNYKIKDYENQLQLAKNRLNSNPYFAKEIMSRALYNFASKIMDEN